MFCFIFVSFYFSPKSSTCREIELKRTKESIEQRNSRTFLTSTMPLPSDCRFCEPAYIREKKYNTRRNLVHCRLNIFFRVKRKKVLKEIVTRTFYLLAIVSEDTNLLLSRFKKKKKRSRIFFLFFSFAPSKRLSWLINYYDVVC